MFSSKLRTWMENHIVRPRKKSNKNTKNSLSSNAGVGTTMVDPKKTNCSGFNVYHNSGLTGNRNKSPTTVSNTHGSMAGSSSSTTGGCSSVISSPARRREVSPIQSHTPSRYGWQSPDQDVVTSPTSKSDTLLHASAQTKRAQDAAYRQNQFINDTISAEQNESAFKAQQQQQQHHIIEPQIVDCSSSSISSFSWSTASKDPSHIKIQSSNELSNLTNDNSNDANANIVHYEEIYTILRNPIQTAKNIQHISPRPKSDEPVNVNLLPESNMPKVENATTLRNQNDNSKHYGKLLPSRITNVNANNVLCSSIGSVESLQHFQHHNVVKNNLSSHRTSYPLESNSINSNSGSRYKNSNSMPTVQGNNGPLHSLSSPESAYSSYSDGTSPGTSASSASVCQYTPPEYYINMRTGVHYFPKNANSLAIEAHRYKISLNKIEEMSPIDPLPKTSFSGIMEGMPTPGNQMYLKTANESSINYLPSTRPRPSVSIDQHSPQMKCSSSNTNTLMSTLTDFECKLHTSPSPRQRCRIRTNPWYSTTDTALPLPITNSIQAYAVNVVNSNQLKSDTTRSFTCSSSDGVFDIDSTNISSSNLDSSQYVAIEKIQNAEGRNNNKIYKNSSYTYVLSEEETSSSTTVENMKNTVKRKHHQQNLYSKIASKLRYHQSQMQQETDCYANNACEIGAANSSACHDVPPSDDDATLNEMMGKFDESYVYEKETDILSSDSDPTNCPSELDTGQDAGDECDTDELLDIDFIDTSSIQDDVCIQYEYKDLSRNGGNCSYYNNNNSTNYNDREHKVLSPVLQQLLKRSHRKVISGGNYRRKRFMKTRKKSVETREQLNSPPVRKPRETRSVGGTPICLRKKNASENKRSYKTTPLSNRSSSLVFTDVMPRESYRMAVAESEKALIKADLEADVKYRQLILEAESILVSLKSSVQSIPRDTPIVSPRRVNPLSNKRVEMLKNSETVEPKREPHKQQMEQELAATIHKRIELLKYEAYSAPNSPKLCRLSPRKTHLTNFIQQNISSESLPRRSSLTKMISQSPQIRQVKDQLKHFKKASSPLPHSRARSHSSSSHTRATSTASKLSIDSDSESEPNHNKQNLKSEKKFRKHKHYTSYNHNKFIDDLSSGSNSVEIVTSQISSHENDGDIRHPHPNHVGSTSALGPTPFNLIGFDDAITHCPQSEPLKRKVYKNTFNFGHLKQGIDLESEMPKQALLSKINLLRRERCTHLNTSKFILPKSTGIQLNYIESVDSNSVNCINKKQLILNTIADLKRNLEEQSVELNGLNDN